MLIAIREVVSSSPNNVKAILKTDENLKEELLVDQVKNCWMISHLYALPWYQIKSDVGNFNVANQRLSKIIK